MKTRAHSQQIRTQAKRAGQKFIPAMTRADWEALPQIVKYFCPWLWCKRDRWVKV